MLDEDLGPLCAFGSESTRVRVVMVPEHTVTAACRSTEVVRLSMPRPWEGSFSRPGKGRTPKRSAWRSRASRELGGRDPKAGMISYFLCRSFNTFEGRPQVQQGLSHCRQLAPHTTLFFKMLFSFSQPGAMSVPCYYAPMSWFRPNQSTVLPWVAFFFWYFVIIVPFNQNFKHFGYNY